MGDSRMTAGRMPTPASRGSARRRGANARRLLPALVTVALAGSACGGDGGPKRATADDYDPPPSVPATTAPPLIAPPTGPLAPLLGVSATAAVAARPAVAVPVRLGSNVPTPVGLEKADLVVWEAGGRRLVALFQSRDAVVGPVDVVTPSEVRLLPVLRPLLAGAGGSKRFRTQVDKAGLDLLDPSGPAEPAYASMGQGSVSVDTTKLRAAAPAGKIAPPGMFPFADPGQPPATTKVKGAAKASITRPGLSTVASTWDVKSGLWRTTGDGFAVRTANVVVLTMAYRTVEGSDDGYSVTTPVFFGSGAATVLAGGSSVPAAWRRPGAKLIYVVVDGGGVPVRLRRGSTLLVLAPPGSAVAAS